MSGHETDILELVGAFTVVFAVLAAVTLVLT
jgi:hypothetical protein